MRLLFSLSHLIISRPWFCLQYSQLQTLTFIYSSFLTHIAELLIFFATHVRLNFFCSSSSSDYDALIASKQLHILCIVTGLYSLSLKMCLYIVELVFRFPHKVDENMFKTISDHTMPLYKIKMLI